MVDMRVLPIVAAATLLAPVAFAEDMQRVGGFEIDRTEVTVAAFRAFAEATGTVTAAEHAGGGEVYEAGWVTKPGWTWQAPFGRPARDDEPAVHVTFAEARAYCAWRGKRLPTDAEWMEAGYTERRADPPAPFRTGTTYPYPTGETPQGANCLADCGPAPAIDHSAVLTRGIGHAPAGTGRGQRTARHGRQCLGMGGRRGWPAQDHPRRLLVVRGEADEAHPSRLETGRHGRRLYRFPVRPMILLARA